MPGAITIGELAEAKEIIKRFSTGVEDSCAVLERMILIDFEVLSDLLMPEQHLSLAWKQISGRAVVQIPPEITKVLANLTDEQRAKLAHQWAQSEEFRGMIEEEDISNFLVESILLAQASLESDKSLLFINF